MVTKYRPEDYFCDYGNEYVTPDMEEHSDGTYVLATDYAAIVADRDEWKRRCEAMKAALPQDYGCDFDNDKETYRQMDRKVIEKMERILHPQFYAEGRDNG